MPFYNVTVRRTINDFYAGIEADTPEEAYQKALKPHSEPDDSSFESQELVSAELEREFTGTPVLIEATSLDDLASILGFGEVG